VVYDGNPVIPTTISKPPGSSLTTVGYTDLTVRLEAGSTHSVVVTARDTQGNAVTLMHTYTIPPYVLVPGDWRLTEAKLDVPAVQSDGTVRIRWPGGGTLQAAPHILGPWNDVSGAASPFDWRPPVGAQAGFLRVKRP
jgi:hypothetical protein